MCVATWRPGWCCNTSLKKKKKKRERTSVQRINLWIKSLLCWYLKKIPVINSEEHEGFNSLAAQEVRLRPKVYDTLTAEMFVPLSQCETCCL